MSEKNQFKWYLDLSIESEDFEGAQAAYERAKEAFYTSLDSSDDLGVEAWEADGEDK